MTAGRPAEPEAPLGVVGAGQMGRGIAQLAATAGIPVRLYDSRPGVAIEGRAFACSMIARAAEKGRLSESDSHAATTQLAVVERLADLADCAVVVEAIVEDLQAKSSLFASLESVVAETAILASNTSSLSVTALASACRRPERVAGFHFFNPVPLMKVVEVVTGQRTAPETCTQLVSLARRMGHRPVQVMDTPGSLVNHAGRAYSTEALRILSEGVAAPHDIDRIMREACGFPMGPFELFDLTGLDVSHAVMESIYRRFYEEPRVRPQPESARRVAAGLLGRKTGEGFYRYADGRRIEPVEEVPESALPKRVWIGSADGEARQALLRAVATSPVPLADNQPPDDALCIVTPLGHDATMAALREGLDPARTVAVDSLPGFDRRITVMATPLTTPAMRGAARALFADRGLPVTVISDSPGFIAQRMLAAIVNLGCEIAQQGLASPADIDDAVRLGLGYPCGPLSLGDRLGPARVLAVLEAILETTGDPRYRASLWLRRRAALGISLTAPRLAD